MPELIDSTNYVTDLLGTDELMILRSGVVHRLTRQTLSALLGYYNAKDYGAKGDGIYLMDVNTTSGSAVINSASASFTSADVGKYIKIPGAKTGGRDLIALISSVQSATQCTLNASAGVTLTGAAPYSCYGTDDTSSIQNCINAAFTSGNRRVFIPKGVYVVAGPIVNNTLQGGIGTRSQLYIPDDRFNTADQVSSMKRGSFEIYGQSVPSPMPGQYWATGSAAYDNVVPYNSGSLLESFIQIADSPTLINTQQASMLATLGPAADYGQFNAMTVKLENLTFRVNVDAAEGYPRLAGVNMAGAKSLIAKNVAVNIDKLLKNVNANAGYCMGFIGPWTNCELVNHLENILVAGGFFVGIVISEHMRGSGLIAYNCHHGVSVPQSTHSINIADIRTQNCIHALSAWPVTGLNQMNPGKAYLNIGILDVEKITTGSPSFCYYVDAVNDPSNLLYGKLTYHMVDVSSGALNTAFVKTGGANMVCAPLW